MPNKLIQIGQYDYEGLCKSFLAQDRKSAKTAGNRLSYCGKTLYSYDSVLARISHKLSSTLYIDKHISTYSNTSRKHTNKLTSATPSYWNVFTIDFDLPLTDNLTEYWEEVEYLITKYHRARTLKPRIKQQIHTLIRTTKHFAELHKFDTSIPDHIMRLLFVYQLLT